MQLPAPNAEMVDPVDPEAVHWPLAVKVTGSPEEAVAATLKGNSLMLLSGSGSKVIVCELSPIWKVRATSGAGANSVFPAWWAVTVQLPVPKAEIVEPKVPLALHWPLAVKDTGSPEEAVADTSKGKSDGPLSGSASKVIACELRLWKQVCPRLGSG